MGDQRAAALLLRQLTNVAAPEAEHVTEALASALEFLESKDAKLQTHCWWILSNISKASKAQADAVMRKGVVPLAARLLMSVLDGKHSAGVLAPAVALVANLAHASARARETLRREETIEPALQAIRLEGRGLAIGQAAAKAVAALEQALETEQSRVLRKLEARLSQLQAPARAATRAQLELRMWVAEGKVSIRILGARLERNDAIQRR